MIRIICEQITQEEVPSQSELAVEQTIKQDKVDVLWSKTFEKFDCHNLGDICQQLLDGEPVFIIRAQDKFSVDGISAYKKLMWAKKCKITKRINDMIREFRLWRKNNKDKIKVPD